jgi:hypothetical protein
MPKSRRFCQLRKSLMLILKIGDFINFKKSLMLILKIGDFIDFIKFLTLIHKNEILSILQKEI